MFKCLSLGLGLEANEFKEAAGGDDLTYMLKINYYPPCPRPDLVLGVVPHTDASSFTILVPNEVQGLQVFKDEHWYDVKYIPNALIVHIGDQIEVNMQFTLLSIFLCLSLLIYTYIFLSFSFFFFFLITRPSFYHFKEILIGIDDGYTSIQT